jgi:hypothetical protein
MLYHVPENLGMMLLMLFFGKELLSLAGKMGHLCGKTNCITNHSAKWDRCQ